MSLWFGGDYNPEQWPRSIWDEDIRLMRRAGVTVVTVGVFAWAQLERSEGRFDFDWLDDILDRLHAAGIGVFLATATASPPPWLSSSYPETLPVTAEGVRLSPGSRQHISPHSRVYRERAARLVRQLALRYGEHPAVVAWHVGNEYGCHVSRCYSDEGAESFRRWLARRYGTVEALNAAWGTTFWSQAFTDFEQVLPPRAAPTFLNPTQLLDFDRFSSDALLECYRAEVAILRELTPHLPVSTNFMGAFKPLDYWAWAAEVDFVCDDSYPDPADPDARVQGAMTGDLMRSLRHGQPWILAEQATSAVNWRARNPATPPGTTRLKSLQAVARGADGIMYFQWRQSVVGAEKFHSAMLPHAGADSRIFREVEALGAELGELGSLRGTRRDAEVAIVLDWESWWAVEQPGVPSAIDYLAGIRDWYAPFYRRHLGVDFVPPSAELSAYRLVVVPHLLCARRDAVRTLAEYVRGGGSLLVTFQSLILDEDLHVPDGGYLGELAEVLGVRIEEFAPLADRDDGSPGRISVGGGLIADGAADSWSEFLHLGTATTLASFTSGEVAGWPAITVNARGRGLAYYVATRPGDDTREALVDRALRAAGIDAPTADLPPGVELVSRGGRTFVLNHSPDAVTVDVGGLRDIPGRGAVVL